MVIEGPSGIGKTVAVMKALNKNGISDITMKLSARKPDDVTTINKIIGQSDLGIVLIDDFHKLSAELKERIADFLKTLADEEKDGTKIVIVGINRAGDTLIKFASDLVNRIDIIRFETNPHEKIMELIEKGEQALNIEIASKNDIVTESHGSFYLAQMLAHEICLNGNILEHCKQRQTIQVSLEVIKQIIYERQSLAFKKITTDLATGPKLRKQGRAPYFHVLYWLAKSDSWSISIDDEIRNNPDHRSSVQQIIQKGYLNNFFNKNPNFSKVIHLDSSTYTLTVEDPQFIFFLRNIIWNKFAKQLGYKNIHFESKYDFALSFAGLDRNIAKMIFEGLTENEIDVFYDENEKHRILAQNIEDYLGPIYKSEAKYVVCLLSPNYPERIWTKFESEQFKDRFGTHSVIPIIFKTSLPGMFDPISKVGSICFDPSKDVESQLNSIVELLIKKLDDLD